MTLSPKCFSECLPRVRAFSYMSTIMLAHLKNGTFTHLIYTRHSNFPNCFHMPFMAVKNSWKSRIQWKFTHCIRWLCLFNCFSSKTVPPLFVYCQFFTQFFFYWSIIALQCCVSSAAQQSESAIHIHISSPSWASLPNHLCPRASQVVQW